LAGYREGWLATACDRTRLLSLIGFISMARYRQGSQGNRHNQLL
jgi:hypothetical protein